jgi:hypothetical protein
MLEANGQCIHCCCLHIGKCWPPPEPKKKEKLSQPKKKALSMPHQSVKSTSQHHRRIPTHAKKQETKKLYKV